MHAITLAALPHLFSSIQLDDNSLALIAMLAGMLGGWMLTGYWDQLKAKRAKVARKS